MVIKTKGIKHKMVSHPTLYVPVASAVYNSISPAPDYVKGRDGSGTSKRR